MNESSPNTNSPSAAQYSPAIDIRAYGLLIWRWIWLILLCALLAAAAAYYVSSTTTPVYRAKTRLMLSSSQAGAAAVNYSDLLANERAARTYAELLKRRTVLRDALTQLGLDNQSSSAMRQIGAISVTPVRDTQLIDLTVEGTNPQLIAAVANTLPQVFVTELQAIQSNQFADSRQSFEDQLATLERQIEETQLRVSGLESQVRNAQEEVEYGRLQNALTQYQSSYAGVLQSYENLRLAEIRSTDNVVVMEAATIPSSPVRPRTQTNTLLAGLVGAMLALGVVFLMEFLDDRVRTPEELRRITDAPVLGVIGVIPSDDDEDASLNRLISVQQPRHPIVESYRRLRTNLQYYNIDRPLQTIAVTSANPSEGKSMTAGNLAVVMAQSGVKVLLIDADLRKPKVHRLFGLPRKPGLAEALIYQHTYAPAGAFDTLSPRQAGNAAFQAGNDFDPFSLCKRIPEIPNLYVMTAGEKAPNPAELLSSNRMSEVMKKLHESVDVIIFDTPPLLAVTDAQIIGRLADGMMVVINTRKTSSGAVYRALESLVQVKVPIMGAILNQVSQKAHGYTYYYYAYEYYGAETDDEDEEGGGNGKMSGASKSFTARKSLDGASIR
ncbi:MAG: P-loop NTPase [Caldilineaceae bacterium]|nr:P-loop NTPase [Caldilineaceae bacterium]